MTLALYLQRALWLSEMSVQPDGIVTSHDAAIATRKQADPTVSRADVDNLRDDPVAKARFLSTFTADEERKILNKVNRHFFLLIGIMYMIKSVRMAWHGKTARRLKLDKIDTNNASNVRVLQVGQPRNIMIELGISSDEYNWVGSIYGVSPEFWQLVFCCLPVLSHFRSRTLFSRHPAICS